jgi:uncharacterized membrane protein YphA (DoxX/SURF4 family)
MKLFSDILHWFETHNGLAYSLIRIFLGIALFIRGWILISDPSAIIELGGTDKLYWWYSYISIAHLIGGFLLTLGLITRLATLLQIPILAAAVFYVHFRQGLVTSGQSLELSVLVLILLVIYFLFGSGVLAVDNYIAKKKSG